PAHACKALASAGGKATPATKAIECLPGGNVPPSGAIDKAMLLVLRDKAMPDTSVTHMALHTSSGWFVDPDGPESFVDATTSHRFKTDVYPNGGAFLGVGAVPGTSGGAIENFAEITHVTTSGPSKKTSAKLHAVRGSMVLCAVGPSGAPSCLDPIRGELQIATAGAPDPSPKVVPFEIVNGTWTADPAAHLT